ncbi:hypothetical protein [Kribbella speibonae]|uniref:DUF4209 domain-containing protein n=1 Tax=Kribbella speibonae TaxID=1572660 RepID=A0ABY2A007_9ACTN|nr:hypothetical protein [Kribbella speibonae]TCC19416.1 hypothetical protein E0H58_31410 [Kribbella speibonae]
MTDGFKESRRLKFYGAADFATYWQADRVAEVAERFKTSATPATIVDAIELHNVQLYIESGLLPTSYSEAERAAIVALAPQLRAAVAKSFALVDETNLAARLGEIPYDYHADLLELLGRSKAFERCNAEIMLPALKVAGVGLGEMLGCKKLVTAYDERVRDALIADVRNAENLIRKYLQEDVSSEIHLPKSLIAADMGQLLSGYLDDADANLNFVRLIATAAVDLRIGIDAKLKLKAKRCEERMVDELFKDNSGLETGAQVRVSDSQDEPVKMELDGMVATFTYSRSWLDQTLDNASVLNNFQHLFEFADGQVLLTLPSYSAELGVFERHMTTLGRKHYQVGAAFRAKDMSSLVQTRMYHHYLSSKDSDVEAVIAWFFDTYLVDEFEVHKFSFAPSARTSSYLEKARHLFAEMEGVVNQFRHYAQDGELDRELLALTSDPIAYDQVSSLLEGKYVYATEHEEIRGVLYSLFSDQSGLTYINETLNASSASELIVENELSYTDFLEHQRPSVDQLIELGVLEDTGVRVQIANTDQFVVLRSLFAREAAAYHRLSPAGRTQVDALEARGWVTREAALLSKAEASYFNYFLNKVEFSNGPELRNKYLHGSQAVAESEDVHFHTYVTALRMLVLLVIKINDEFCLWKANGDVTS